MTPPARTYRVHEVQGGDTRGIRVEVLGLRGSPGLGLGLGLRLGLGLGLGTLTLP